MTENAFTQAEAALVDKIVRFKRAYGISDDAASNMAWFGIAEYAKFEDQEAAAQAVIQLVKERLNA
jgi:hypothetical protein